MPRLAREGGVEDARMIFRLTRPGKVIRGQLGQGKQECRSHGKKSRLVQINLGKKLGVESRTVRPERAILGYVIYARWKLLP